jgi:thymidylate synthase|uniref:thymidylate synthase n=1 Tax=viral metagenome TaxID=1070528 RepID=A0A6C0CYG9_9ZZZZ
MLKHVVDLNKFKNRDKNQEYHEEYQYLNLIQDILNEGTIEKGRNGFTKCSVGSVMHFSLENNKIPILTTKKTAWKTCLKELLWFIKGQTSNKILNDQKVHIWDGNSTKEFKESRGLEHYKEGDLGPLYGYQWRFFNAPYDDCDTNYSGKGVDQLQQVIDCLKDPEQRTSRRLVVSAWNPCQIDEGVLPPCHVLFQFNVVDGNKLSCTLYQRSCDEFLGIPFNISSYSFLTHLIAKHCDLEPYEFIHYGGNCHIYDDHFDQMEQQISRQPFEFPTIEIINKRECINDYVLEDFKINNYQSHDQIKGTMRA